VPWRVSAICGLAASVTFMGGVFVGDLAQPDAFSPADDDISDLGALTASSPWPYDQVAANHTGLLVGRPRPGALERSRDGLPSRPAGGVFSTIGNGASARAASVVRFLWLALVAFRLLRVASERRSAAAPG
jgi:hypothetical protein